MFNNINEVQAQIAELDEGLAQIFLDFAGMLSEEIHDENEDAKQRQSQNRNIIKEFPNISSKIVDGITKGTPINIFPYDIKGPCQPICLCKAFGKWNSYKSGFKGIADYLINHYFNECSYQNKSILILTFAWDELDFIERFKEIFDDYTEQYKIICVVLVTLSGFSIQYLR
jgi:hypothetical protein